jgi:hypothetical protein
MKTLSFTVVYRKYNLKELKLKVESLNISDLKKHCKSLGINITKRTKKDLLLCIKQIEMAEIERAISQNKDLLLLKI